MVKVSVETFPELFFEYKKDPVEILLLYQFLPLVTPPPPPLNGFLWYEGGVGIDMSQTPRKHIALLLSFSHCWYKA